MKRFVRQWGVFGVFFLLNGLVQGGSCNDFVGCKPCESAISCRPSGCFAWLAPTTLGGCAEAGFYANRYGQKTSYGDTSGYNRNGIDPISGNTFLLANVEQTGLQLNQIWLYAERKVDSRRGFDLGYRADVMFGTDGRFQQSNGDQSFDYKMRSGDYYTAIPNLYAEVGYQNVRVKAGKFESPLGYEAMYAPDRFFYSETYSFGAAANTHSGILGEWDVDDRLTVSAGWVTGIDKTFDNFDDNAFLGGLNWKVARDASLAYAVLVGNDKTGPVDSKYYQHMVLFQWQFAKRWNYALEWTLTDYDLAGGQYGINQEFIYTLNSRWALGFRAEWLRDNNVSADMYEFTFGANWTPTSWFLFRPEIRYDRFDDDFTSRGPFDGTRTMRNSQVSGGCSAVVKF